MSNDFVNQVIALTNNIRSDAGLAPLKQDSELANAAQNHSKDMALQDFFNHDSLDGSSPFERIEDAGYEYSEAAENIAVGQATPKEVVESWMNSPGHRANILDASLQDIGVGFYNLKNDTGNVNYNFYWTQDFGTPLNGAADTPTPSPGEENTKSDALAGKGYSVNLGDRASRDTLTGADGSDNLTGSTGADLLTGGSDPRGFMVDSEAKRAVTATIEVSSVEELLNIPLGSKFTAGDSITAADLFGTSQAAPFPMSLDMASTTMFKLS